MNTFVETKKNWGNLFLVLFVKKKTYLENHGGINEKRMNKKDLSNKAHLI